MGTLIGHVAPAVFCLIFGIWWSFMTAFKYANSKLNPKSNSYRASITHQCICMPCNGVRRAPIESFLKIVFLTAGFCGELFTAFRTKTIIKYNTSTMPMNHHEPHNHHDDKRDILSMMIQSNSTADSQMQPEVIQTWFFLTGNGQHMTIYFGFLFGAFIEVLKHYQFDMPENLDWAMGCLSFLVEAFIFSQHIHGKDPVDVLVHTLLVYAILGCLVFAAMECYNPHQILFTYGRVLFLILQGTWFLEVGFVLYPLDGIVKWTDDMNDIMWLTQSFVWHIVFIMAFLSIQYWVIKSYFSSSHLIVDRLNEFSKNDDRGYFTLANDHNETKFLRIPSEDEESGDEKVQFDVANRK